MPPSFVNNRRSTHSRIEYAWASNFTLQVVLGLQRTFLQLTLQETLPSGCILNLSHCKVIPLGLLVFGFFFFFKDWNGLLHYHATFARPCVSLQRGLGKTVCAFHFVLHHFCSHFIKNARLLRVPNTLILADPTLPNST